MAGLHGHFSHPRRLTLLPPHTCRLGLGYVRFNQFQKIKLVFLIDFDVLSQSVVCFSWQSVSFVGGVQKKRKKKHKKGT